MIQVTQLTSIPEDVFNTLYDQSIFSMDNGTFDWSFIGLSNATNEDKKSAILSLYNDCLSKDNSLCILFEKDGLPRGLYGGTIEGDYWRIYLGLYGANSQGSKSDMYGDYDHMESMFSFINSKGCVGWEIDCFKNESIYNFHTTKPQVARQNITETFLSNTGSGKEYVRLSFTMKDA